MTATTVNPKMVVLARESRELNQSTLARHLGITQGALSKIEGGVSPGPPDLAERLERALGYPAAFFSQQEDLHGVGTESFHQLYRRRKAISAKTLKRIEAQVNLVRMNISKMLNAVEFERANSMPRFDLEEFGNDVEKIAATVRASWMLPSGPIASVTKAIEDAGGIVVPFDFGTEQVDATSLWYQDLPPLVFYNQHLPGDRQRFSLAHELGHIVMHSILANPKMEEQADRFACEFLMPARDIGPQLNRLNLRRAAQLKPYWKVSMGSLIMRAKSLYKLTDNQYQYLWVQMGAAGWRTREPAELDVPVEQPTLHEQLIQMHLKDLRFTIEELSKLLHVFQDDLRALHGLVPKSVTSGLRVVRS